MNNNQIAGDSANNVNINPNPNMLLTPDEAIEHLRSQHGIRVSKSNLSKLRHHKMGPDFTKILNRIYYSIENLDKWVHEQNAEYQQNKGQ